MTNQSLQRGNLSRLFAERKSSFTLRMAPMIDMIFLLLIFFLVAAKWRPEENFLPFKIPTAQASQPHTVKPESLPIFIRTIPNGCEIRIGQDSTLKIKNETIEENLAELIDQIHLCLSKQKRFASDPIEIICEPQVKWDYTAKIYNIFYGAGLSDITFQMTE